MSSRDGGLDPVALDRYLTTPPDDDDEDLSQPPEPGMEWNPAREEWSHEPMTRAEWASLTPSEREAYPEPSEDIDVPFADAYAQLGLSREAWEAKLVEIGETFEKFANLWIEQVAPVFTKIGELVGEVLPPFTAYDDSASYTMEQWNWLLARRDNQNESKEPESNQN